MHNIVKTNESIILTINKQLMAIAIEKTSRLLSYTIKRDDVTNLSSHPVKSFYCSYHNNKNKQYFLNEENKLHVLSQSPSYLDWIFSPTLKSALLEDVADMKISPLQHEICLSRDGTVYGRGYNGYAQLGYTEPTSLPVFTKLSLAPGLKERITQIACGENHTLLLSVTGDLYSFGNNSTGQLGSNNTKSSAGHKVEFPCKSPIKKIKAIGSLSMFLTENGELYGCGQFHNSFFESTFIKFTKVDFPKENVQIVDFILESGTIIALDVTGTVYVMSRLGSQPQQVATNIVQISSGFLFLNKDYQVESPYCEIEHHKILIEEVLNKQFIESKSHEVKRVPSFHDVRFSFGGSNQHSIDKQVLHKQGPDIQEDSQSSCMIM